jgi:hypothetical protein
MKKINVICPRCNYIIEYGLTDKERKEIFSLLTSDPEFMRELGKQAAEQYLKKI